MKKINQEKILKQLFRLRIDTNVDGEDNWESDDMSDEYTIVWKFLFTTYYYLKQHNLESWSTVNTQK